MDKELKLIFVNHVGTNWRDLNLYEFIFSNTTENIDGDDWDVYPAVNGRVSPPPVTVVKKVGFLETELEMNVVSKSDKFSMWDAIDKVTALAYEDLENYTQYPETRLVFHFGDDFESVTESLYAREIILEYNDNQ